MGKFLDIGSHQDMILQWGRHESKIIDLQGKMLLPDD